MERQKETGEMKLSTCLFFVGIRESNMHAPCGENFSQMQRQRTALHTGRVGGDF